MPPARSRQGGQHPQPDERVHAGHPGGGGDGGGPADVAVRRHTKACGRIRRRGDRPGAGQTASTPFMTPSHGPRPRRPGEPVPPPARSLAAISARPSSRLARGPASATRCSVRASGDSPFSRDTPPNIHRVMPSTSMPAARATVEWAQLVGQQARRGTHRGHRRDHPVARRGACGVHVGEHARRQGPREQPRRRAPTSWRRRSHRRHVRGAGRRPCQARRAASTSSRRSACWMALRAGAAAGSG